jgi:ubiquinone/menaquinone biosynthesis C-methylase UbiE
MGFGLWFDVMYRTAGRRSQNGKDAPVSDTNGDPLNFSELVTFYERIVDPLTLPMGRRALDLVGLTRGDRLIDVAAGTGALAAEAAQRGMRVLAVDVEPKMVARAAARLAPFPGSEAREMNFDAMEAPDASFDAAVSIVGVLAFPGGQKGLHELVRVTRPGGSVAVATWDQEQTAAPQYLASDVFAGLFPDRQLWPADFFPAWTKDEVVLALREAGCTKAEMHSVQGEWVVQSPAAVMAEAGASIRMFPGYKASSEVDRHRFEDAYTAAVVGRAGPDGTARIMTRAFVGVGRIA